MCFNAVPLCNALLVYYCHQVQALQLAVKRKIVQITNNDTIHYSSTATVPAHCEFILFPATCHNPVPLPLVRSRRDNII